ncbi:MAG: hypothetical protein WC511_02440 [Candidatus Pacearchaeota archaeon]
MSKKDALEDIEEISNKLMMYAGSFQHLGNEKLWRAFYEMAEALRQDVNIVQQEDSQTLNQQLKEAQEGLGKVLSTALRVCDKKKKKG